MNRVEIVLNTGGITKANQHQGKYSSTNEKNTSILANSRVPDSGIQENRFSPTKP